MPDWLRRTDNRRGDTAWGTMLVEQRQIRCMARVRLSTKAGLTGTGRIRDISASGAFVETSVQLGVGMHLHLFILGNETARDVVERGATVVSLAGEGIGVEWDSTATCTICSAIGCVVPCADRDTPGST